MLRKDKMNTKIFNKLIDNEFMQKVYNVAQENPYYILFYHDLLGFKYMFNSTHNTEM